MATSEGCDVCHIPVTACPHRAGLRRAMAMFPGEEAQVRQSPAGVHEFQFFGSGGADSWLVNGPGPPEGAALSEPGFRYVDFLRSTCEPGRLTLDAPSSARAVSSASASHSPAIEATVSMAAELPLISFSGDGAIGGNSLEMAMKEAEKPGVGVEHCEANAMNREARVLRYREKKKRRKFEKQIRYASRKAYAEMRPRVKGRFAKVPPEVAATQPPHQFDVGWYQFQHHHP